MLYLILLIVCGLYSGQTRVRLTEDYQNVSGYNPPLTINFLLLRIKILTLRRSYFFYLQFPLTTAKIRAGTNYEHLYQDVDTRIGIILMRFNK